MYCVLNTGESFIGGSTVCTCMCSLYIAISKYIHVIQLATLTGRPACVQMYMYCTRCMLLILCVCV